MISKLNKIFSIKTIRNRIIGVQLAVVIPSIVFLGILIYGLTSTLLIKMNSESYYKVLESSDVIMNQYLNNYRDTARNILSDKTLQREMIRSNEHSSESALMNELTFINLNQAMEKYLTGFYGVQSIYLYDCNGKAFYYDHGLSRSDRNLALDYEKISESAWFQKVYSEAENGYEVFFGYNVINENEDEFSCVKVLKDLATQENLGTMILNFNKGVFDEVFPFYEEEKGNYAIIEDDDCGWYFLSLLSNNSTDKEELEKVLKNKSSAFYLASYEDKVTGWQLIYAIRHNDILGDAASIKDIIGMGLVVTIMILLILTIFICNRITKPLYQLKDDIVRVGNGERYVEHHFSDDEVGAIGQEFRKMVNEKLALSERIVQTELKNKEAELELLQSNINPHFLYNTLDSLYWMAIYREADDVAELTKALSDVFRIALSKGEKKITIREELDFIRSYLSIQNISFEGKICADIQIDEKLLDYKIIKLLLQPFVENAVYHGLEPKVGGGSIRIRIYEKEEYIHFEISDDGVGMEDVSDALSKGYAVRNSMERIRLIYGEKADVQYKSEPGCGTQVAIKVPKGEIIC